LPNLILSGQNGPVNCVKSRLTFHTTFFRKQYRKKAVKRYLILNNVLATRSKTCTSVSSVSGHLKTTAAISPDPAALLASYPTSTLQAFVETVAVPNCSLGTTGNGQSTNEKLLFFGTRKIQ